ncbi:hypothetical protein [Streptomyces alboflavus]|uniref:hypothetical protein n=1 Tax=Streptomyces alboflavus TaxID=67267 RepID=UPI0005277A36|nr:hypothetical protein [Streptomyces alboflavus]
MWDSTRKVRSAKAEEAAALKVPQWGPDVPVRVVFEGYGEPVAPERREAELTRFIGWMVAHGWTQVHRMPGAVLLAQTHRADGGAAMGVGAVGVATGAAVGGAGLVGVLFGIVMIFFGALLTLTIIGAFIGIPMIAAGMAAFGGGAAVATAGGAVGAGGAAVGIGGAVAEGHVLRLQAWTDETGRIYTKGA